MLPSLEEIIKENKIFTVETSKAVAPNANDKELSYAYNEIKDSTKNNYILVKTGWPYIINNKDVFVKYIIYLVKVEDKFWIVPYSIDTKYPIQEYTC